jgi:hypothetical protein
MALFEKIMDEKIIRLAYPCRRWIAAFNNSTDLTLFLAGKMFSSSSGLCAEKGGWLSPHRDHRGLRAMILSLFLLGFSHN